MKKKFQDIKFIASSLELIGVMCEIIDQYAELGYDLSARQLYYQLVTKNIVPNSERSYKRVTSLLSDARLAGLVDWDMIADRGSVTMYPPCWTSAGHIVEACAEQFRLNRWNDQTIHIELLVEKQALEGVIWPVCQEYGIHFTSNKGYSSSSSLYGIGQRLRSKNHLEGKSIVVLYLGDHDPSGIDMTRDVEERLTLFSGVPVEVVRIALNMDQVEEFDPPENPVRLKDSRAQSYIEEYGRSSWELDALTPSVLAALIHANIRHYMDEDKYDAAVEQELKQKAELGKIAKRIKK